MRFDASQAERSPRIEPTTSWGAFTAVRGGLIIIAFSAVWMIGWFTNAEGWAALIGWVGLLFVSMALIMMAGAVRGRKAMRVLESASTATHAAVLDRYSEAHDSEYGGTSYTYHLVVQFRAGERRLVLEAAVSKKIYDASRRGQSVIVRYADADPRIVLIEGEDGF